MLCAGDVHRINAMFPLGRQMYLHFKEYKLTTPNNCEANFIDVYGEKLSELARKQHFCGTQAEPVRSDDNQMNIRFFARYNELGGVNFEITFTAFREVSNKGLYCIVVDIHFLMVAFSAEKCLPSEFDC